MGRSFHRRERLGALSEINVTPLIDLAFALLIIFMITAPLLEQSIAIELPVEAPSDQPPKDPEEVQIISINEQGVYFWGRESVSEAQLSQLLEGLAAQPYPPVIHLRADRRLPYQKVIHVIDRMKQNNLTRISLDTAVQQAP